MKKIFALALAALSTVSMFAAIDSQLTLYLDKGAKEVEARIAAGDTYSPFNASASAAFAPMYDNPSNIGMYVQYEGGNFMELNAPQLINVPLVIVTSREAAATQNYELFAEVGASHTTPVYVTDLRPDGGGDPYTFELNDLTDYSFTLKDEAAYVEGENSVIADRFIINYVAPTCTTVRTGMVVDNYYTICLPKAVTGANGASFWNMSNRGDGVAYLEEAELPLVAGRPYIIQAEDAELCVEYSGDAADAGAFGALHGTLEPMDQAALNAKGSDVYLLKNNQLWKVSGQTGNSLAANRAYIKYDELNYSTPNPAPGRRVRAIPMQDQSTTGVENLNAAEAPVKTVIDGKMYILRGEHMFDATGRMVK